MKSQEIRMNAWDRMMAAVTFAEAGEPETAMEIMGQRSRKESHPSRITDQKRSEKRQDLRM